MAKSIETVALIGLGLIGSSIARGVSEVLPHVKLSGYDRDPAVRARARELSLAGHIPDEVSEAVAGADLVILCVPVGAMEAAGREIGPGLKPNAIVSEVGSCKAPVLRALRSVLPDATIIPGHPIAGTEKSGPDAGFAALFHRRWCILTPEEGTDIGAVERLAGFWQALGAKVQIMGPERHDLVLAVTSHLPHLIAFTIVGTASHLEEVTEGEVIKYSAGGFRDFTRIAASDPTMWRDVFLANSEAVLEVLQHFQADLDGLVEAIRSGDGASLFHWFSRTRDIRRAIVYEGQDVAAPDFGRST